MKEKISFSQYHLNRINNDNLDFWENALIKKSYFVGAYARAIILSSWNSPVSKENTTFKVWLSNQIINYRNLDRIFEIAFRFEQKLQLNIRNTSEVRHLAHEVPVKKSVGISSSKISYAFVAGYDDYNKFIKENPISNKNSSRGE